MKKTNLILLSSLLMIAASCKKELSQPEAIKKITSLTSQKNLSKETFENELLPIVKDLYKQDSVKFSIIIHIAKKAQNEKNKEIFDIQVKNLKNEINFVK